MQLTEPQVTAVVTAAKVAPAEVPKRSSLPSRLPSVLIDRQAGHGRRRASIGLAAFGVRSAMSYRSCGRRARSSPGSAAACPSRRPSRSWRRTAAIITP